MTLVLLVAIVVAFFTFRVLHSIYRAGKVLQFNPCIISVYLWFSLDTLTRYKDIIFSGGKYLESLNNKLVDSQLCSCTYYKNADEDPLHREYGDEYDTDSPCYNFYNLDSFPEVKNLVTRIIAEEKEDADHDEDYDWEEEDLLAYSCPPFSYLVYDTLNIVKDYSEIEYIAMSANHKNISSLLQMRKYLRNVSAEHEKLSIDNPWLDNYALISLATSQAKVPTENTLHVRD